MKNRCLLIATSMLLVAGCQDSAHLIDENALTATTRDIITAEFEAFNKHDIDALVALYSEDAETRSPGDLASTFGRDRIRETYQGHFDNIPDVHDSVQNIVAEGENGAVEFIASWSQPTADDPDARGSLKIAAFLTVRDGKIVKDITYFDRVEFKENMTNQETN